MSEESEDAILGALFKAVLNGTGPKTVIVDSRALFNSTMAKVAAEDSARTTPWRQGWDAAHDAAVAAPNSVSVDDNPYPEGTEEHGDWDTGYRAGWEDEYPEDASGEQNCNG